MDNQSQAKQTRGECDFLLSFQLNIAERWLGKADRASDPFSRFFFLFTAFNALYFAWGKADDLRNSNGQPAGESPQISNLLRKVPENRAAALLANVWDEITFFVSRPSIQRMDHRTCADFDRGNEDEGRDARKKLKSDGSPIDKLVALGKVL